MAASQKPESIAASAPMRPEDILTAKELSNRLHVSMAWVYKHTDKSRSDENRLPVLRCDGFLRFYWPAVCEWLRGKGSS